MAAMRKRIPLLLIATTAYCRWSNVHALIISPPHLSRGRAPLLFSSTDDDAINSADDASNIVEQSPLFERNSSLWRIGSTEVNFPEKYLVLNNFTIDHSVNSTVFANEPFALSVKRVKVIWDNLWYTTRTFQVEMQDVDFLLEFTSFNLGGESNWDELVDQDLFDWLMADYDEKGNKYDEEGFFHFSSFLFLGNATIQVASRPLGKQIGRLSVDASNSQMAKDFNHKIGRRSDENLLEKGRKGIMFAELADLAKESLDELIESKLHGILKSKR